MKEPSEKGDQFAVSEYMKGGLMVTHPYAPLPRINFFIRSPSPSPEPDTPPMPPTVAEVPHELEVMAEPCPKPGHTTKVPPRLHHGGNSPWSTSLLAPVPSEDEEEEDEPPTKYRCV